MAQKPMAKQKRKPKPKLTDKAQSERFRQTARELGCDESEGALGRAFAKIVTRKKGSQTPQ